MVAKSNAFAFDLLRLILNATSLDKIAEDNSVDGVALFYLALHTADPGAGGTQSASETNYVGYARQAVNRTAAALPVTAAVGATPPFGALAVDAVFPNIGVGSANQVLTHFSLGLDAAGAGEILYRGAIAPTLPISAGQSGPVLAAGTFIQET